MGYDSSKRHFGNKLRQAFTWPSRLWFPQEKSGMRVWSFHKSLRIWEKGLGSTYEWVKNVFAGAHSSLCILGKVWELGGSNAAQYSCAPMDTNKTTVLIDV